MENDTNELKPEQVTNPPEVQAATFIQRALPAARHALNRVTGTQAKRVLMALLENPFEEQTKPLTTPEARELFQLGLMIQNSKFVLFQVALDNPDLTRNIEEESRKAAESESVKGE